MIPTFFKRFQKIIKNDGMVFREKGLFLLSGYHRYEKNTKEVVLTR
jgi:hypothetical protein